MLRNNTKPANTLQALDHPVAITRFPSQRALAKKELNLSVRKLAGKIEGQMAASKDKLPWLKLATFGDAKSAKGCLRTNANVTTITGLEADYDAGRMTPETARAKLAKAGVGALIYTTPSHTPDAPRWRVLCPFSGPLPPDAREDLMARLNGVLGGGLDPASFTLSQAYYAGGVEGGAKVQTFLAEGDFIDNVEGLKPIYKDGGKTKPERGESAVEKTGLSLANFHDALMHVPNDESEDRDYWFKIMCGVHHETDGSEDGLAMILEWSEPHPSYDYENTVKAWESISFKEGGAGGATVTAEARFKGNWVDLSDLDEMFDPLAKLAEIDALLADDAEDTKQLARGYDLTEDGVIRAFSDRHDGELLFDHTAGAWFRFGSHRWVREETLLAKHYARAVSTELSKRDPNAKHLKKVAVWEAVERGARTVRAFAVSAAVWDREAYLLGTPGGVVDLRTGKLRPGRPNDRISKATAATPIPLASFDPERHCPRWMAFLQEALGGDSGAIRFLQQWFGYCLTGYTREHALVFVYGPGGSGKSTAINIMADLLGDYAINVATSTLTKAKHDAHPEELARMDVDTAIQRRFNILPFDHPPKRKDPKLIDKLRREFPGILAWAMQGTLDWQANGLVHPEVVDAATSAYFAEQDTFRQWLEDHCEIGAGHQDTSADLWESWQRYAYANGEDPGSKKGTFPETLKQRGFTTVGQVRGKRGRGFKGLKVRVESDGGDGGLI